MHVEAPVRRTQDPAFHPKMAANRFLGIDGGQGGSENVQGILASPQHVRPFLLLAS
jgi:hypothetical protein